LSRFRPAASPEIAGEETTASGMPTRPIAAGPDTLRAPSHSAFGVGHEPRSVVPIRSDARRRFRFSHARRSMDLLVI
jgi:hypothetical protein